MKILLHICCAPCTIYPLAGHDRQGHQVRGFFFNPNIHPYQEFARRAATLESYAAKVGLPVIWDRSYPLEEFLRTRRLPGDGTLPLLLLPAPDAPRPGWPGAASSTPSPPPCCTASFRTTN